LASLILVVNAVGELQRKRTLTASRGFLAAARLSCFLCSWALFMQKSCEIREFSKLWYERDVLRHGRTMVYTMVTP